MRYVLYILCEFHSIHLLMTNQPANQSIASDHQSRQSCAYYYVL